MTTTKGVTDQARRLVPPLSGLLVAFGLMCASGLAESGLGRTFVPPLRRCADA